MKKILLLIPALAVMALSGCQKEQSNANDGGALKVTLRDAGTKTAVVADGNGYKGVWNHGDKMGVFVHNDASCCNIQFDASVEDGMAIFDGTINFQSTRPSNFKLMGYYPRQTYSFEGLPTDNPEKYPFRLKSEQTPVAGSFDPECDLVVMWPTTMSVDDDNKASSNFYHGRLLSVVRLDFTDVPAGVKSDMVNSIEFEAMVGSIDLTGDFYVDLSKGELHPDGFFNNQSSKVKLNFPTAVALDNLSTWMVVYPATLPQGGPLKVTIDTDNNTIVKTTAPPTAYTFPTHSKMPVMSFDLSNGDVEITPKVTGPSYQLGDFWPNKDEDNDEAIVFWLEPGSNGTKGKVMSIYTQYYIDSEDGYKWFGGPMSLRSNHGCLDFNDGSVNMTALQAWLNSSDGSSYTWSTFPAWDWFINSNEFNNGDSAGPWYIPALNELCYMFCLFTGIEPQTWTNSAPSCDEVYMEDFNYNFLIRGDFFEIDSTSRALTNYWSSNFEADDNRYIYTLSFKDATIYTATKTSTNTFQTRPVRKFGY